MKFRSNFVLGMLSLLVVTTSIGCKKDDSSSSSYPKDVTIEFKVTNITGVSSVDVTYPNETGGLVNANNVALPWSRSFTRNVKFNDVLLMGVSATGASATAKIKCDILINGTVVATKSPEGSTIYDQVLHTFQ